MLASRINQKRHYYFRIESLLVQGLKVPAYREHETISTRANLRFVQTEFFDSAIIVSRGLGERRPALTGIQNLELYVDPRRRPTA